MNRNKKLIEEVFGLIESNSGLSNQKVLIQKTKACVTEVLLIEIQKKLKKKVFLCYRLKSTNIQQFKIFRCPFTTEAKKTFRRWVWLKLQLWTPNSTQEPVQLETNSKVQLKITWMEIKISSDFFLLQTLVLELEVRYSQDVMVSLRLLASECYWLACLLALNNPPLQPDWQNHILGMDPWDIFPSGLYLG